MAWMVLKDAISKQNTKLNKWVCNIAIFKALLRANKFSSGNENPNQWNRRRLTIVTMRRYLGAHFKQQLLAVLIICFTVRNWYCQEASNKNGASIAVPKYKGRKGLERNSIVSLHRSSSEDIQCLRACCHGPTFLWLRVGCHKERKCSKKTFYVFSASKLNAAN